MGPGTATDRGTSRSATRVDGDGHERRRRRRLLGAVRPGRRARHPALVRDRRHPAPAAAGRSASRGHRRARARRAPRTLGRGRARAGDGAADPARGATRSGDRRDVGDARDRSARRVSGCRGRVGPWLGAPGRCPLATLGRPDRGGRRSRGPSRLDRHDGRRARVPARRRRHRARGRAAGGPAGLVVVRRPGTGPTGSRAPQIRRAPGDPLDERGRVLAHRAGRPCGRRRGLGEAPPTRRRIGARSAGAGAHLAGICRAARRSRRTGGPGHGRPPVVRSHARGAPCVPHARAPAHRRFRSRAGDPRRRRARPDRLSLVRSRRRPIGSTRRARSSNGSGSSPTAR